MKWIDSGSYHWAEWTNDDSDYDYFVRVACGTKNGDRNPCFLPANDLPNVNAPDGASELVVINGSIFDTDGKSYGVGVLAYNNGGNVTTYSYQVQQYNFGTSPANSNYLSMYSEGNENFNFTTTGPDGNRNVDAGWYPVTLGCDILANGTGPGGANATTSHSFIGRNGVYNYAGYCTGVTGATAVSYLTNYYGGGTCAILDGGGSTFCRYKGTTKQPSSRAIHNAIAVYYKKKSSPTPTTQYTITTNASPSAGGSVSGGGTFDSGTVITLTATANSDYEFSNWSNGETSSSISVAVSADATYTAYFTKKVVTVTDDRRLGTYAVGLTYVYKDGSLKQASPWYRLNGGALQGRPEGIYQLQNGALVPLILKNYVSFNSNGGSSVGSRNFYSLLESITSFDTPSHGDYDSRTVTFDGWFYDNTFATKVIGVSTNAAGDRTYYAKWKQTKTQYSGYYETSSTSTQSIPSDSYTGSASPVYFRAGGSSPVTHSSSITVTSLYVSFDNCYSDWTGYVKPQVDYGYFTGGEGSSYYTHIGTLYSSGEDPSTKSVSFTLPQGSSVGFRVYRNGTRTNIYLNSGGSYKYGGTSKTWVGWQDSSSPPSGSWASGYPLTRTVTRYYDGSSWSDWQ